MNLVNGEAPPPHQPNSARRRADSERTPENSGKANGKSLNWQRQTAGPTTVR
jgi:hypothetical protein